MGDDKDNVDRSAHEVRLRSIAILNSMVIQRNTLRDAQREMSTRRFKRWAQRDLGMDELTLKDMLEFDGTTQGITDRMVRWLMNTVTGSKLP